MFSIAQHVALFVNWVGLAILICYMATPCHTNERVEPIVPSGFGHLISADVALYYHQHLI